ncbi:MAG: XisI protein [Cyanothece sp. SIO2G6]|nr:XisI protein [Cyanothece sp. SIO2G6]
MAIESNIETYRQYIQDLLLARAKRKKQSPTPSQTETQAIFDQQRDHYQLVHVGWRRNGQRNYGCVLHLDIKDGKIWIQHDGTEDGIASALVELSVPKTDIVLGFHDPFMRQYTGFAVD